MSVMPVATAVAGVEDLVNSAFQGKLAQAGGHPQQHAPLWLQLKMTPALSLGCFVRLRLQPAQLLLCRMHPKCIAAARNALLQKSGINPGRPLPFTFVNRQFVLIPPPNYLLTMFCFLLPCLRPNYHLLCLNDFKGLLRVSSK